MCNVCVCVAVSEFSGNVCENIQPDLHNAANRSLERMSSVSRSNAARLPFQHLGRHQRTTGI